jgi:hypothetical protein
MAQNYKQRIHEGIWDVIDAHPRARVSDTLVALDAVVSEIWRQLPAPKKGKRQIDKHGRSYVQDALTKRYRLA